MNINRIIIKLSPKARAIFGQRIMAIRQSGQKEITHDEILALATEAKRQAGEIK